MKRVHFTASYLMNPAHPVTVNLIGGGGTGSQVLTCLARLDVTLRAMGHPGLFVTLYDPDTVAQTNIGRQLFGPADVGINKAVCLLSRVNNFFGNDWKAEPRLYPEKRDATQQDMANIFITCTDNIRSRLALWECLRATRGVSLFDHLQPLYWLDFGNTQTAGQVVLGSIPVAIEQPKSRKYTTVASLKVVTKLFDYSTVRERDSGPSCSLADALEKQDLFINSTLAQFGCDLLWKMFRNGMIHHQGMFLSLENIFSPY